LKVYTIEHATQGEISYVDRKRHLWILSMLFPFILPMIGVLLFLQTDQEWTLTVPLMIAYILIPILDWVIGEDDNNPPEELVPQLEADRYYLIINCLTVPLHMLTLVLSVWFVHANELSLFGMLITAIVCGLSNGFAINTAHELGHKYKSPLSRNFAKIALAVPFYGHFTVEHNRGHHKWVATPEDPASSRLGESIYKFATRELWLTFIRGISLEKSRLARQKKSFWSTDNHVLQSYALSVIIQGSLVWFFGAMTVLFLVFHNVFAWFQLTSANYIEHYGLLRDQVSENRYESCKPHHSWNSNHSLSNLTLFNLERHSDHHANPTRSYQSLRDFPDIPRLPNGYFGMYLQAYFPWVWFKVMDQRVLSLPHVGGDLSKVNVDPAKAEYYKKLYGDGLEGD
jgi:alkane 1-monooxygenase